MLSLTEERGIERGRVLEGQNILLRQLRRKFGQLPSEVEAAVRGLRSPEEIEPYADRILTVSRLEEMGFPRNGSASDARR